MTVKEQLINNGLDPEIVEELDKEYSELNQKLNKVVERIKTRKSGEFSIEIDLTELK